MRQISDCEVSEDTPWEDNALVYLIAELRPVEIGIQIGRSRK